MLRPGPFACAWHLPCTRAAPVNLGALLLTGSLALAAVTASSDGAASNYPPDYVTCGAIESITAGPFEIIRKTTTHLGHGARLSIVYRGPLRERSADAPIHFYVQLNGNDILVEARRGAHGARVTLIAGPRNCVLCVDYHDLPRSPCAARMARHDHSGTWLCEDESPDEKEIFTWAYDAEGHQNAWDIELAAESSGSWDSNLGANYHARFEPLERCY